MKYYYLFILIVGITTHILSEKSELNSDQEKQIDCLIIASDKENAIINKVSKEGLGMAYHIETISNEKVTPMAVNDQFVKPVHKYGIPGKEPEYDYHNESLLGKKIIESVLAVIHDNSKHIRLAMCL